jgi:hypothetical protein
MKRGGRGSRQQWHGRSIQLLPGAGEHATTQAKELGGCVLQMGAADQWQRGFRRRRPFPTISSYVINLQHGSGVRGH